MELDEVRERLRQFSDVAAQTDDPLSWFEEVLKLASGTVDWQVADITNTPRPCAGSTPPSGNS